jgi:rare lipoprotein A
MDTQAKFMLAALLLVGVVGVAAGAVETAVAGPSEGHPLPRATSSPTPADATAKRLSAKRLSPDTKLPADRSGRKRIGKASFYANMFAGRKMADGTRMQPTGNNAASLTLPLGTTAKVTNLETGKTAVVTIRDRGPYVAGRIVDLSPATAREIGLDRRTGVTQVAVAPITVPLPNGQVKLGDGIIETTDRVEVDVRLASNLRIPQVD